MDPNQAALREVSDTQRRTREALDRIQRQAAETEEVGYATMATLEEQDRRMDKVADNTDKLNENLEKTNTLQNKFSRWTLQFGNRGKARKEAKKERKEEKMAAKQAEKEKLAEKKQPTFKRRTRGKPAITDDATPALEADDTAAVAADNEADRAELFGGKSSKPKKNTRKKKGKEPEPEAQALTDEDQRMLDQIENEDKDMDNALDALGLQMENMMNISKSLGETTQQQNKKLDKVSDGMDKAKHKQRVATNRTKLFTMNRREKRQDNQISKKVAMASKLAKNM